MKRELGSNASITILGGPNDGAVGTVLDYTDMDGVRIHLVRLPDGTIVEVARALDAPDTIQREIGS
jgi:hypothetical protein